MKESAMDIEFVGPRSPRSGDVWVNPHNNTESSAAAPNSVLRHYLSGTLEDALSRWGRISDPQAIEAVLRVIAALETITKASVFEVFFLDSTNYLAVVLSGNIDRGTAFVNPGHVDHYIEIDGSVQLPRKPGIWRTYLPTSRSRGSGTPGNAVLESTCDCSPGVIISVYAECDRCGIRSIDQVGEYQD
jgi:hypothetical protein